MTWIGAFPVVARMAKVDLHAPWDGRLQVMREKAATRLTVAAYLDA
jgi:hypothetical protein